MKPDDRKFYHSFPRSRAVESTEALHSKELATLRRVKDAGLVLAMHSGSYHLR